MKQPKELWAFWANRSGPWWATPQKVKRDDKLASYWHKNGNADIRSEGVTEDGDGYLAFAHRDKNEVQKFIDGFMACRRMMAGFYVD